VNLKFLNMTFLTVDFNGAEWVWDGMPHFKEGVKAWVLPTNSDRDVQGVELPKGSIARLIGRPLSWEDEPVELNEDSLTPKAP